MQPRSNARWPSRSALVAHDAQCAAAGVTTVLDALCLGDLGLREGPDPDLPRRRRRPRRAGRHRIAQGRALPASALRAAGAPTCWSCSTRWPTIRCVRMVSLMDHSPGVGPVRRSRLLARAAAARTAHRRERRRTRILVDMQAQRERLREPNRRALLDARRGPRHRARQPRRPHRGGDRGERRRRHPASASFPSRWPPRAPPRRSAWR